MSVDILAIGVHPDDVELACSGTLIKHIEKGYKVALLDLTKGELGTRGTPELRREEALASAKLLGVVDRVALDLGDGFFRVDTKETVEIVKIIRKFRPTIVLGNAPSDRHPDHGRAHQLIKEACFYSGLKQIETELDGVIQEAWRPKNYYSYIQDRQLKSDFVVDITDAMDKKMECIMAFGSQFYNPNDKNPDTPISSQAFLEYIKSVARVEGRKIGVEYAEGFIAEKSVGIEDLLLLK